MGNIARYLPQALHKILDAVEHSVDIEREPVQVVPAATGRYTSVEATLDNRPGGLGDFAQTLYWSPALSITAGKRQQDRYQGSPGKCIQYDLLGFAHGNHALCRDHRGSW